MNIVDLHEELGGIDIYLLDLLLKGNFAEHDRILDAGCGGGRNCHWLLRNGYDVTCIDKDVNRIHSLRTIWAERNSHLDSEKFIAGELDDMPFEDGSFEHAICSAVLHFANNHTHFQAMMSELVRVLKPGGTMFIRMTSDIGIKSKITMTETGVVRIPDGSYRYLITRDSLKALLVKYNLSLAAPFKNVNVEDVRVMCVLVLRKN